MRHILLVFVLMVLVCCGTSVFAQDDFCSVEVPGQVFCDDFSDGDAQDGMPVTWTERPNSGDYDATSGDYVLTPTTNDGIHESREWWTSRLQTSRSEPKCELHLWTVVPLCQHVCRIFSGPEHW